jgi:hypothetical protein
MRSERGTAWEATARNSRLIVWTCGKPASTTQLLAAHYLRVIDLLVGADSRMTHLWRHKASAAAPDLSTSSGKTRRSGPASADGDCGKKRDATAVGGTLHNGRGPAACMPATRSAPAPVSPACRLNRTMITVYRDFGRPLRAPASAVPYNRRQRGRPVRIGGRAVTHRWSSLESGAEFT